MKWSGHIIGLLKEYTRDLVEQAKQDISAEERFGLSAVPYRPDQALSDLLALLDDRIESEGMQVGLPEGFLHEMWAFCNEVGPHIADRVWLEMNVAGQVPSKARTRELTYLTLIALMEAGAEEPL